MLHNCGNVEILGSCFSIQSATADWIKGVRETMLEFIVTKLTLTKTFTAWKVFVFGVILVRIFPHADWITPNTDGFYAVFYSNVSMLDRILQSNKTKASIAMKWRNTFYYLYRNDTAELRNNFQDSNWINIVESWGHLDVLTCVGPTNLWAIKLLNFL